MIFQNIFQATEIKPIMPMSFYQPLRLAFLMLVLWAGQAISAPRIAVIAADPKVAGLADLLSAALAAKSTKYSLVERAELQKLAAEAEVQKLAADKKPVAMAKLAKADGILVVEWSPGGRGPDCITLRLIASGTGIITSSLYFADTGKEHKEIAKLATEVLRYPCERLGEQSAKPPVLISLQGLRPAIGGTDGIQGSLNIALSQQLAASKGVAVLERWCMRDILFERALEGGAKEKLATGTAVVDGSYTRNGDEMIVDLRVSIAGKTNGEILKIKGSASKLPALAGDITAAVVKNTGATGGLQSWSPEDEGASYASLAWWLMVRGFGAEAADASESAIALGYTRGRMLRTRLLSYQTMFGSATTMLPTRTSLDGLDRIPFESFEGMVKAVIRLLECSLATHDSNWNGATVAEVDNGDRQFTLGKSFDLAMKVLQAVHVRGDVKKLPMETATIRRLARELESKTSMLLSVEWATSHVQGLYRFDSPEDAELYLRQALGRKYLSTSRHMVGESIRKYLWCLCGVPELVRFVDWTNPDNRHGFEVWDTFAANLSKSADFVEQCDGIAFAVQAAQGRDAQERILLQYCELLEKNQAKLLTPDGQLGLVCLSGYFGKLEFEGRHPMFIDRMTGIMTRLLATAPWIEPSTMNLAVTLLYASGKSGMDGKPISSLETFDKFHESIRTYLAAKKNDPRIKQYQSYSEVMFLLLDKVKEQRQSWYLGQDASPSPGGKIAEGTPQIKAWIPDFPGKKSRFTWMCGDSMQYRNGQLIIPTAGREILVVNDRGLKVDHVIMAPGGFNNAIASMDATSKSIVVSARNRLFTTPRDGDGKDWGELPLPPDDGKSDLTWMVSAVGENFVVGSLMMESDNPSLRMFLGQFANDKLSLLVSSDRRPAVNPLDDILPADALFAYRNAAGKTIVALSGQRAMGRLVELESGRNLAMLPYLEGFNSRGDVPLFTYIDPTEMQLRLLLACDPSKDFPVIVFRSGNSMRLTNELKNAKPLYDQGQAEFAGTVIAGVSHGGYIWLLKKDPLPGSETHDPCTFRLVRLSLRGAPPVVVPLEYAVPENIMALADQPETTLRKPVINPHSLVPTESALVFTASGHGYGGGSSRWLGLPSGGYRAQALLYVEWEKINQWIAKSAPNK